MFYTDEQSSNRRATTEKDKIHQIQATLSYTSLQCAAGVFICCTVVQHLVFQM